MRSKRAICEQGVWLKETIVNNSIVKTNRKEQNLLEETSGETNKF